MISYVRKMFTVLDFLSFLMLFPNWVKGNQAYVTSGWPKAGESEGQGKPCGFSLGSWMAGWSGPLLNLGARGHLLCLAFQRHVLMSIDSIQSFACCCKNPTCCGFFPWIPGLYWTTCKLGLFSCQEQSLKEWEHCSKFSFLPVYSYHVLPLFLYQVGGGCIWGVY